jgi:hypothetical protein
MLMLGKLGKFERKEKRQQLYRVDLLGLKWCARGDSNSRPSGS